MVKRIVLLAALLATCFAGAAAAHDLWVADIGNTCRILNGHGEETQSYDASSIRGVRTYTVDGAPRDVTPTREKDGLIFLKEGDIAAVFVFQEEGFWTLTTDGYRNTPKRGLKDVVESAYYLNYAKTLFAWSEAFTRPLGMPFEIVPQKNPLALKTGDVLPVVVYFRGKPLGEAWVDEGAIDSIREKCDSQGRIGVPIGKPGRQTISAYHSLPYREPADAEKESFVTNLTFTVR